MADITASFGQREFFRHQNPENVLKNIQTVSQLLFLLESRQLGRKVGALLLSGFDPILSITCRDAEQSSKTVLRFVIENDSPNKGIKDNLAQYKSPDCRTCRPFRRRVGYLHTTTSNTAKKP
jgi:hypothetical protein